MDGSIVSTQEEIKAEAVDYFQQFSAHDVVDYRGMEVDDLKQMLRFQCEEADTNPLAHEVTSAEVKKRFIRDGKQQKSGARWVHM